MNKELKAHSLYGSIAVSESMMKEDDPFAAQTRADLEQAMDESGLFGIPIRESADIPTPKDGDIKFGSMDQFRRQIVLEDLNRVNIKPGDRLVVKLAEACSGRAAQHIGHNVRAWAGVDVKVIVLQPGQSLEHYSSDDSQANGRG